jgi:hypothetical protein
VSGWPDLSTHLAWPNKFRFPCQHYRTHHASCIQMLTVPANLRVKKFGVCMCAIVCRLGLIIHV